ncbi:MAG: DciA family protein [Candidatus Omnitrophica bacterium]|nr:DciA family protein [Candidatus Omnitrophota bacterium]
MTIHISDILKGFFKEKKKEYERAENITRGIKKILGNELGEKITIDAIEGKKIFLSVNTSSASYEVFLRKKELLEEIKKLIPYIEEIKIKVG